MNHVECAVCGNNKCELVPGGPYNTPIRDCPRCGGYVVLGTANHILPALLSNKSIDRSVLSHLIRKGQRLDEPVAIFESDLQGYRNAPPLPRPAEQAANLILWIGDNQHSEDAFASSSIESLAAMVGARISGAAENAFQWLLNQLESENWFVSRPGDPGGRLSLRLRMEGWNRYEELRHQKIASRTAFMAMQFGDPELQIVLETCFKSATKRAGFELRPLNEKQPAGLIDNQIRAAIRSARFVVADLTHDNNGAYFEAGFAEGLNLPVLYTCEAKRFQAKKTHFDTNHMVTIPWDVNRLEEVGNLLTATIRATLPGEADPGPP